MRLYPFMAIVLLAAIVIENKKWQIYGYTLYAGCESVCPDNFAGIYCKDKNIEACRGCTFEQCKIFAEGNNSYGLSYVADDINSCILCNEYDVANLWAAFVRWGPIKPYGVYTNFNGEDCLDTTLTLKKKKDVTWKFGPCNSPVGDMNTNRKYFQKCCIAKERFTLTCENWGFNRLGHDFAGGDLMIQEHKFCDVFFTITRLKLNVQELLTPPNANDNAPGEEDALHSGISDPNLIPMVDDINEKCPHGTRLVDWTMKFQYVDATTTKVLWYCYCEEFCRWDICRLDKPPQTCLAGTKSYWFWDSTKRHWVAQISNDGFKNEQPKEESGHSTSDNETSKPEMFQQMHAKKVDKKIDEIALGGSTVLLLSRIMFSLMAVAFFIHNPKKMLNDRNVLLHRTKIIFSMACFFFAIEMTISQIVRYLENRNSSSVSYKTFNASPRDRYPAVSICFRGKWFTWYHNEEMFESIGVTPDAYMDILKGQNGARYEYLYGSGLFSKVPLNFDNMSSNPIGNFHLKQSDIFASIELRAKRFEDSMYYGKNEDNRFSELFGIGLLTPDTICFTRNSNEQQGMLRSKDILAIKQNADFTIADSSFNDVEMSIHLHYPGQLWRSLENPQFRSELNYIDFKRILELKISNAVVERSRPDSNIPCNNEIDDDDKYLLHQIVERVGCVPPYWKNYFNDTNRIVDCKTSEELAKLSEHIENYEGVLYSYAPPCVDMTVQAVSNKDRGNPRDNETLVIFSYMERFYQEISNTQDFSFESFWSTVGGFIGIFLGYPLLQLPDLLSFIVSLFKNCSCPIKKLF